MLSSHEGLTVQVVRVPISAVKALTPKDRYAYYLLGHMFNELMFLQKLLIVTMRQSEKPTPPELCAGNAQALIVFRIAAGKLWEAWQVMTSSELSHSLRESFLPLIEGSKERWKELSKTVSEQPYLKDLRNKQSFHYPRFREWEELLEPRDDWADDLVFASAESGNLFFDGAESYAQEWMFSQDRRASRSTSERVDQLLGGLVTLMTTFTRFVEEILSAFVHERLMGGSMKAESLISVAAPPFSALAFPYWTLMPKQAADPT